MCQLSIRFTLISIHNTESLLSMNNIEISCGACDMLVSERHLFKTEIIRISGDDREGIWNAGSKSFMCAAVMPITYLGGAGSLWHVHSRHQHVRHFAW